MEVKATVAKEWPVTSLASTVSSFARLVAASPASPWPSRLRLGVPPSADSPDAWSWRELGLQ
eukprot:5931294-Alexandrium_andersonii.AAC.1